jgi:hypothetical protein
MYYPIETRIAPMTTIRRERLLPVRGQVLVQPGDLVGPQDVVARCEVPGEIRMLDVSRCLKTRRDRVGKLVRVAEGDMVQAGDLLAAPWGLLGRFRKCRSPLSGQVVAIRNGIILIQETPQTVDLLAHVKGLVANVMPDLGVVVSASGAWLQGIWGSGGESEGIIKLLVDSPQKPLRARSIDVSCHGTLIVGGRILDEKIFEPAIEAKVRGIIAGSANASLRPQMEALPFPIVLTEGFGTISMAEPIFSLLQDNMGREAILSANIQTRYGVKRPDIFIPLRAEEVASSETDDPAPLTEGARVRVVCDPYMGQIGVVTQLPIPPQMVESGIRLPVAEVNLADGGPVVVPIANLERIR